MLSALLSLGGFAKLLLLAAQAQAQPLASSTQPEAAKVTPVFTLQATTGRFANQYAYLNGYATDGDAGRGNPKAYIHFTFTNSSSKASQFFVDTELRYLHPYHPGKNDSATHVAVISEYYDDPVDFGKATVFMATTFPTSNAQNYPLLCPGVNNTIGAISHHFNCNWRTADYGPRPSFFYADDNSQFLDITLGSPNGPNNGGPPVTFHAKTLRHL